MARVRAALYSPRRVGAAWVGYWFGKHYVLDPGTFRRVSEPFVTIRAEGPALIGDGAFDAPRFWAALLDATSGARLSGYYPSMRYDQRLGRAAVTLDSDPALRALDLATGQLVGGDLRTYEGIQQARAPQAKAAGQRD